METALSADQSLPPVHPLRLYDAYSRLAGFGLSHFGDAYGQKTVRGTGAILRALLELCLDFFAPGDSRILEDANLRDHLCVLLCYARRATRQQIAFSPVCIIALNAPKRLSPAETLRLHGIAATQCCAPVLPETRALPTRARWFARREAL